MIRVNLEEKNSWCVSKKKMFTRKMSLREKYLSLLMNKAFFIVLFC